VPGAARTLEDVNKRIAVMEARLSRTIVKA
jgi:hypothetical protein